MNAMNLWDGWQMDAVLLVILTLMMLWMRRTVRVAAMQQHLAAFEATLTRALGEQQTRMTQVESRIDPTAANLGDVRISMARMEAQIDSALKEIHASRAAVRRVEDYLLRATRSSDHDSQF